MQIVRTLVLAVLAPPLLLLLPTPETVAQGKPRIEVVSQIGHSALVELGGSVTRRAAGALR